MISFAYFNSEVDILTYLFTIFTSYSAKQLFLLKFYCFPFVSNSMLYSKLMILFTFPYIHSIFTWRWFENIFVQSKSIFSEITDSRKKDVDSFIHLLIQSKGIQSSTYQLFFSVLMAQRGIRFSLLTSYISMRKT